MVVLFFAIPAVVILGSLLLLAASRRNEAMKVEGQLSRETRQRDLEAQEISSENDPATVSGRDIERAAVLERAGGTELEIQETAAPVPWTAPDEEAVGVARRQFLNRSIVGLMGLSISSFGAAVLAFLW